MTSVASSVPTSLWYDADVTVTWLTSWILQVSATVSPPMVHSISYGAYEYFMVKTDMAAFDIEAIKLGVRGVTLIVASGDDGIAGPALRTQALTKCGYYPQWPASSAYVTTGTYVRSTSTTPLDTPVA